MQYCTHKKTKVDFGHIEHYGPRLFVLYFLINAHLLPPPFTFSYCVFHNKQEEGFYWTHFFIFFSVYLLLFRAQRSWWQIIYRSWFEIDWCLIGQLCAHLGRPLTRTVSYIPIDLKLIISMYTFLWEVIRSTYTF